MKKLRKKNTIDTYYRIIRDIYQHFKPLDMNDLLRTKEKQIIDYIEEEYKKNIKTIKAKLSGIKMAYKILKIDALLIENKIQEYGILIKIEEDKSKEENRKPVEEGEKN